MLATIDRDLQALVAEEKVAGIASTRKALRAVSKAVGLIGHMTAEKGQVMTSKLDTRSHNSPLALLWVTLYSPQ